MRGHVHERDRDELVRELLHKAAGAEAAAHAARPEHSQPVEARHEQDGPDQPEQEGQLERVLGESPRSWKGRAMSGEMLFQGRFR